MLRVNNKRTSDVSEINNVVLVVTFLLTLNIFLTFFYHFICWLCTGKCLMGLHDGITNLFPSGEVKTLILQLLRGVRHMHDNWILHRDIKASNLLLSHKGILKVRIE